MFKYTAAIISALLLATTAEASIDMCLKKMRDLNLRRTVTAGNTTSGVSTTYLVNDEIIISSYLDPKTNEDRVIVHKPGGHVDVSGKQVGCSTERSDGVHKVIANILEHNMSSKFYMLKKGGESPASESDVLDLVSRCGAIKNETVSAAVQKLETQWGFAKSAAKKTSQSKANK